MTAVYKTGQITLANGSAVVTGVGTAWATMLIAGGIIFPVVGGNPLAIQEVVSNTAITAEKPWAGVSGTYDYVLVRWSADEEQNSVNSSILATIYAELQAGSLWKYDVAGSTADRAIYNERPKGFSYLVIDTNPAQLYIKASATSADWAGPFTYATGPTGPAGPAGYVNLRGAYSGVTAYAKNDGVLYNGSSFVALQATTGNAPPTLPATSNAYWQLLAIKGTDGAGTGDVVGPAGAIDDMPAFFDGTTGKLIKVKTKAAFKTWLAPTAADVSFSNTTAALPGAPATVQAAIDSLAQNSGGKQDAIFALEIADLKGVRMGMNGGIADSFDDATGIVTSGVGGIDGNTFVALHLDGTAGSTTITDSSFPARAWTASGNAQIDVNQSKFGGASLLLDGTGDYVSSTSFADLAFGTGDYTIDFWVRFTTLSTSAFLLDMRSTGTSLAPCMYVDSVTKKISLYLNGAAPIASTTTPVLGTWYHVALIRNSGVTRLYINGVQEGSSYTDANNYIAQGLRVGLDYASTAGVGTIGNIEELRISKGVARWTAAFTPPTGAYTVVGGVDTSTSTMLHFDGANGSTTITNDGNETTNAWSISGAPTIDTSVKKFGASSLRLPGSGYLAGNGNSAIAFGTGDFTVDFWINYSSVASTSYIIDFRGPSGDNHLTILLVSQKINVNNAAGATAIVGTTTFATGSFYHVAVVRSAGVLKLYVNGSQEGSNYTDSYNYTTLSGAPKVGIGRDGTSGPVNGYIDELRISKGVARWTTNFTPYNVAYFLDVAGSSNFVYDATNDWFSPSTTGGAGGLVAQSEGVIITDFTTRATAQNDGVTNQAGGVSAAKAGGATSGYSGKNYSASPKRIASAIVYGSNDVGLIDTSNPSVTLTLYGKNGSAPTSGTDGTSIGTLVFTDTTNESAGRTVTSTDQTTLWDYVWVNIAKGDTNTIYLAELQFNAAAGSGYNNMTLLSVTYPASTVPGTARIALQLAGTVAFTPNVDFSMEVSRDGGTTWTTAVLVLTVDYGGVKMYEATVSLSAQPSGSNMVWRLRSLTNKNVIASGVVLQQS